MPSSRRMLLGASGGEVEATDVFSPDTYTGNGTTQSIDNGIDLINKGGLVWIKARGAAYSHFLLDTARGVLNRMATNSTAVELSVAGSLTAFNSDGFDVGSYLEVNENTENFISWTFRKALGFFDIVTYTGDGIAGRTVAHELGLAPGFLIVKRLDSLSNWFCLHNSFAATSYLLLDQTSDLTVSSDVWNDTEPTDTEFSLGDSPAINASGGEYVAYLFANLDEISDAGGYTGNGTNQTIDCGFTTGVRFVMIKRTDDTGDWYIWDSERGIVTGNDPHVSANTNAVEVTTDDSVDTDSTGFVVNQDAATDINVNTATYIYLAIA